MGKLWPRWASASRGGDGTPLLAASDLTTLFGLATLTALAWSLPASHWAGLCRRFGPLAVPMLAGSTERVREQIEAVAGTEPFGNDPQGLLERLAGEHIRSILQVLRCHRPGSAGWYPDLVLDGAEHVTAALERGQGAILWVSFSVYGELLAKMAFHRAGLAVDHLSRPTHGFSPTRFGRAVLNPIQTRAEVRFLRRRVVLDPADPGAALGELASRLKENGIVSITVHRHASRPLKPRLMGGEMTLAPGAPLLARRTGAALLPVFPFRDGANSYRVTIGDPIDVSGGRPGAGDTESALAAAALAYAERLEPYVKRYPDQWRGWVHL